MKIQEYSLRSAPRLDPNLLHENCPSTCELAAAVKKQTAELKKAEKCKAELDNMLSSAGITKTDLYSLVLFGFCCIIRSATRC